MTLSYLAKIGFVTQKINVNTQKINGSILLTYGIIIAKFLPQNKLKRLQFFEKTFLLVDTNIEAVFEILFCILNNVTIIFLSQKLQ